MKSFGRTEIEPEIREDGSEITVQVVDREVTFKEPVDTQVMVLMSYYTGEGEATAEKVGAALRFITNLMTDRSDAFWLVRLMERGDSRFQTKDLSELFNYLIEEWGERPTQPASASQATQGSTGKRSTASSRRQGSTRKTSEQPAT